MKALDALLREAREADPGDRILLRDPIAEHGEAAIEAMIDWIDDRRLAAFAIRVLGRIGERDADRQAVVDLLWDVDRTDLPSLISADLERTLTALDARTGGRRRRTTPGATGRPKHAPGVQGRGYWAMRTSPWERPYVWGEALAGRFRQGWGWADEQDLHRIALDRQRGSSLSEEQAMSWPSRRMLTSEPDGMRVGDLVLAPNLPELGRLSVFRLIDSYRYEPDAPLRFGERFGHILPVEAMATDIDRYGTLVSDAIRSTLRNPSRLWSITQYGGDVERMAGGFVPADNDGEPWAESEYGRLFDGHPPDGSPPSATEIAALADDLGRTHHAVLWQWSDGAAYVQGRSASTTSQALMAWLDRRTTR